MTPTPTAPTTRFDDPRFIRLARPGGIEVTFMDWGATWLSCRVPVPGEAPREVLLAHPTPEDHATRGGYLGATVGRYANRIAESRLHRDGVTHALVPHPAGSRHQLHGGPDGFSHRRWQVTRQSDTSVTFSLDSPDGDQGFPGALHLEVVYTLTDAMAMTMEIHATVDAPCPVAPTQHAYFNLDAQPGSVLGHTLQIGAEQYLPVDAELLPVDGPHPVAGTGFDFRAARPIGGDHDHGWLLDAGAGTQPAAALTASDGKLTMVLTTSMPALQVYTGAHLSGEPGRDGRPMVRNAGVALEPGWLADSPNRVAWAQRTCWGEPGRAVAEKVEWQWVANRLGADA
jgi:aldose 1-epimerase